MDITKTVRLGLTNISVSKPPVVEFRNGLWRVWTAYNPALTQGTYITLGIDGRMRRHTIAPDNSIAIDELR